MVCRLIVVSLAAVAAVGAFTRAGDAVTALAELSAPGARRVAWEVARAIAFPLGVGALPLVYVALRERLVAIEPLRRWMVSGRGTDGGFAGYHELRKRAQSISEEGP